MDEKEATPQFHAGGPRGPQTLMDGKLNAREGPLACRHRRALGSAFGPVHLPVPGVSWGRRTWEVGTSSCIPPSNRHQGPLLKDMKCGKSGRYWTSATAQHSQSTGPLL